VRLPEGVDVQDAIATVRATGYTAAPVADTFAGPQEAERVVELGGSEPVGGSPTPAEPARPRGPELLGMPTFPRQPDVSPPPPEHDSAAPPAHARDHPAPTAEAHDRRHGASGAHVHPEEDLGSLRQRLVISATLTVPVVLLSMIPALQFEYWQWAVLTLASPVAVWGAWPFHRAALVNARHGAATMDTLISLGVTAAYLWSLWALFLGGAGMPGMTMTFDFFDAGAEEMPHIYLETAAAVTTFLLLGRYLGHAPSAPPARPCARCWTWARKTWRSCATV
jgi:Cu+-exporting ATPase